MIEAILTTILIVSGSALLSWPLGRYMAALFGGRFARADGVMARITGGAPEQGWKAYALALLAFNVVMFAFTFALLASHCRTRSAIPLRSRCQCRSIVFRTGKR